jgi:hypothetical protein
LQRYRPRFEQDLAWLKGEPLESFHQYAFATLRQLGANFELLGTHLRWLGDEAQVQDCELISQTAKTMQMKVARAVTAKKQVDFAPIFQELHDAWQRVMDGLAARYAG